MNDDFDAEDLPRPWNWLAEAVGGLTLVAILLVVLMLATPLHGSLTALLDSFTARP